MYVFPVGEVDVRLISKEEFDEIVKKGTEKGHTHCQIMCVDYCDRVESFDSAAFKSIANNPTGYSVYAVKTGFPVYSNCNRFRYDPYVSGVTEKPNNSYEAGFADFMNS